MKFIEDLVPLKLYTGKVSKLYLPMNDKDRRKGSAIMVLSDDHSEVMKVIMDNETFYNTKYFNGYYTDRDVSAIINHENVIEEEVRFRYDNEKRFDFINMTSGMIEIISKEINYDKAWEICNDLKISYNMIPNRIPVYIRSKDRPKTNERYIVIDDPYNYNAKKKGPYNYHLKHELARFIIFQINNDINDDLATYMSMYLTRQYLVFEDRDDVYIEAAYVIEKIAKRKGKHYLVKIIEKNDIAKLAEYSAKFLF